MQFNHNNWQGTDLVSESSLSRNSLSKKVCVINQILPKLAAELRSDSPATMFLDSCLVKNNT